METRPQPGPVKMERKEVAPIIVREYATMPNETARSAPQAAVSQVAGM